MSEGNFHQCMEWLLEHEGGYVDHPNDPAGMTNLGITKATYDDFYGGDATEEVMRAITRPDVEPIYLQNYWNKCMCHSLPSGLDWAVFDWAVNSGPARASKALQTAVKTTVDGSIGPMTLRKVEQHNPRDIIEDMWVQREQFYRNLGHFDSFGKGWLIRNNTTKMQALSLLTA